jgi:hypothetical protein
MSEIFKELAKEYNIVRNGDGWTIINLKASSNILKEYAWCRNTIDVGDWTYSITFNHVPQFWFRNEADATMFTLKWFKDEVVE